MTKYKKIFFILPFILFTKSIKLCIIIVYNNEKGWDGYGTRNEQIF